LAARRGSDAYRKEHMEHRVRAIGWQECGRGTVEERRMQRLSCPHCGSTHVERTRRRGMRERVYSLLAIYPFVCQRCGQRFRVRQRGVRYIKTLW
jgi:predicted RNA-binding Zn-ribbon protein involved in translation (DUF1610 family)